MHCFDEGYHAAKVGADRTTNPYRARVDEENASRWYEWDLGWRSFFIDNPPAPVYNDVSLNDD